MPNARGALRSLRVEKGGRDERDLGEGYSLEEGDGDGGH